jgi:polyhydroxyalkanoate synthesis regulator phasin
MTPFTDADVEWLRNYAAKRANFREDEAICASLADRIEKLRTFTRSDVAALRAQVKALREQFGDAIADAYDLESIADRVEAMLSD